MMVESGDAGGSDPGDLRTQEGMDHEGYVSKDYAHVSVSIPPLVTISRLLRDDDFRVDG